MERNILEPEINLVKEDEFYLFYEMLLQSLKTENVRKGISDSLTLLRTFLDSGNAALYIKNSSGNYNLKDSDSELAEVNNYIGCVINKVYSLVEQKNIFRFNLDFSSDIQNIMFIHIKLEQSDCIVAIENIKKKDLEPLFWERLCDTLKIILKRAATYEKNMRAISIDLLTDLDNRNSYEMKIKKLNEADENLVFGIFDLFRLKYVNDNYSHEKGDNYIKAAAGILNKYWPKYEKIIDENGIEDLKSTGHCIYRIGGDEFVLLTNKENISLTNMKANLVEVESEMISLGISDKLPVGINYGIVKHNPGDSIKQTLENADIIMQHNKKKMYLKYNLERRR